MGYVDAPYIYMGVRKAHRLERQSLLSIFALSAHGLFTGRRSLHDASQTDQGLSTSGYLVAVKL